MADTEIETGPETGDEASPEQYEYVEEVVEYRDNRLVRILMSVVLVLLALLLAYLAYQIYQAQQGEGGATNGANSNGMVWVRSIYGWGDSTGQQLIRPNTVAVSADGLIWTNSNNRAAVAFNPDGTFDRILQSRASQTVPGTAESTQAPEEAAPTVTTVFSLAADNANDLYILDNAVGAIHQLTPEAGIKQSWSIPGANKIAANDTRVAVLGEGSLGVFDVAKNNPLFSFGTRGPGALQFDSPWGACFDADNNVYVADTQNHRVRKFDPTGTLIWEVGTVPDRTNPESMDARQASANELFSLPAGVTVDGNGRVVVIDAFKFQIIVLDPETGEKIASYGDYGQADGLFDNPAAITYDEERDYFVVADTGNDRLQVVRIPGSSNNAALAGLRRLFDRPVWICCFPFLVLLIAAIVVATSRRRKNKDEEAAAAAAVEAAEAEGTA